MVLCMGMLWLINIYKKPTMSCHIYQICSDTTPPLGSQSCLSELLFLRLVFFYLCLNPVCIILEMGGKGLVPGDHLLLKLNREKVMDQSHVGGDVVVLVGDLVAADEALVLIV